MDKNKTAKELAQIGRREAKLMAALVAVQAERCALLQSVAHEAELDPEVVAFSVAPKDDGEG